MKNPKILVVEDEPDILELIKYNLLQSGFDVETAFSAEVAKNLLSENNPDLILLDIMLPGMTGIDFCRWIRSQESLQQIPIIMLTARDTEEDMVKGLDQGADDYISKPFSPKVLISRINAALRTALRQDNTPISTSTQKHLTYGSLEMNTEEHCVVLEGQLLELTISEFNILKALMSHPGRVYTRQQLINFIRGQDYAVTDRTIDFQMVGLRRKLGSLGQNIETVRGVGYRLRGEP